MKRAFYFLTVVFFSVISISCEKDEDAKKDSLEGTKWSMTYDGDRYVIEFTSSKDVRSYESDDNYNFSNYLKEDTYTYEDGNVTFNSGKMFITDVIGLTICYYYTFTSATIENDVMRLKTTGQKLTMKLDSNYNITDMKYEDVSGKNFNLIKVK